MLNQFTVIIKNQKIQKIDDPFVLNLDMIHNPTVTQNLDVAQKPDNPTLPTRTTPPQTRKNPPTPPTPTSTKRKTRSSSKTSNKVQKLADIATNIIAVVDSEPEDFE